LQWLAIPATRGDAMIEGVKLIPLTTHTDERGFFREVLRVGDIEAFGQWSHSVMYSGEPVVKAWHIHQRQTDYWYVPVGVVKAVVCDMRWYDSWKLLDNWLSLKEMNLAHNCQEFLLGDNHTPQVLVIPPGVAHGLKVLQGPAHLFYITSREYDPADEGRIPYDSLGYDWDKRDIR
jgi:dTDP-4-dehydrorhamnose 3,5-epimerase